jgi:hypothetical protein
MRLWEEDVMVLNVEVANNYGGMGRAEESTGYIFRLQKKYAVIVPTNAHKYSKISLYTQWTPTCFGEPCGHLQGCKLQRLLFFTPMDWF